MPLRVLTTIMPLIREGRVMYYLNHVRNPGSYHETEVEFFMPFATIVTLNALYVWILQLCKCSLSINFRFISICHCMYSNIRWLLFFFPKIWLKPISIIYTGPGNKIKVDGIFLYGRVNYVTFKMLINLTQVQTSPEFLKVVVSETDFIELTKEK